MARGSGRRRRSWSAEQKRRIIEETFVPGASVAAVAQRHEVNANLLFKWLRQAGRGRRDAARAELAAAEPSAFVSLGVVARDAQTGGPVLRLPTAEVPPSSAPSPTTAPLQRRGGMIEIELADGARIRVDASVDGSALRRVLKVLKEFA